MNQNVVMLLILCANSEKHRGKSEILPNKSSTDVTKDKLSIMQKGYIHSDEDKLLM